MDASKARVQARSPKLAMPSFGFCNRIQCYWGAQSPLHYAATSIFAGFRPNKWLMALLKDSDRDGETSAEERGPTQPIVKASVMG